MNESIQEIEAAPNPPPLVPIRRGVLHHCVECLYVYFYKFTHCPKCGLRTDTKPEDN